ncbi:MAG: PatB family C-S lyase [Candidatus Rokubacteria bacterium]|nr:PatB family C-S lyase [Candidatus Rokubacteria bacterium]
MDIDFDRVIERRGTDSNKWYKFGPEVLPLWVADMDFPAPAAVVQALAERVRHGVFGYGFEPPEFAEVLVDRLQKRYGWRVSPESLVLIPGVIPGFNVANRALTVPGDGLLMMLPVYPPILRSPGNAGLIRHEAAIVRGGDGGYAVDEDAFARAITDRTRVFLLCNPHNPVGRVFRAEELARMAEICLRRGLTIVSDEIHCDLVFSGHRHVPIASLDPEIAEHTITFMAPSKTWNLAGLKAALAIIPNAALRERFVAARADLVQTVNILGVVALVAAYRDGQPWLDALLRYLEGNRDFILRYVREHLPGVAMTAPEGTYLAWLDCRGARVPDDDPFTFFLERAKVALNDGRTFGRGGEGFVRLNFGCPRSILAEGLDRMRAALPGA